MQAKRALAWQPLQKTCRAFRLDTKHPQFVKMITCTCTFEGVHLSFENKHFNARVLHGYILISSPGPLSKQSDGFDLQVSWRIATTNYCKRVKQAFTKSRVPQPAQSDWLWHLPNYHGQSPSLEQLKLVGSAVFLDVFTHLIDLTRFQFSFLAIALTTWYTCRAEALAPQKQLLALVAPHSGFLRNLSHSKNAMGWYS